MSESKLYAAISAVMKDINGITKDGRVTGNNGYNYITADNVLLNAGQSMAQHGLVIIPSIIYQETNAVSYTSYNQEKTRYECTVVFEMTVGCSDSDSKIVERWVGYGVNHQSPDKALYAAITSGHKYFYLKLFAVAVDNTDSEHDQPEEQPKQQRQQKQTKPSNVAKPTPKQQKEQTPREWLASQKSLTYAIVQTALLQTGKFQNSQFALDMIMQYPNYPDGYTPTKSMAIGKVESALAVFDWCLNNTGKEGSND